MSLKIALVGNPNSGKTTLYNSLTGSNQYVGNWPGVTVEKKEGLIKDNKDLKLIDLPGIYSLSPYTSEEVISRNYLTEERPDCVINIIDGSNIERNLYLTTQLLELDVPVIVAINMMDIVNRSGDEIDFNKLSDVLGCPCIPISAVKSNGLVELVEGIKQLANTKNPGQAISYPREIETVLSEIRSHLVKKGLEHDLRYFSVKLFERDIEFTKQYPLTEELEAKIQAVESKLDTDSDEIITNERYLMVSDTLQKTFKQKNVNLDSTSDIIDKVVTNRILALPIFVAVMFAVYFVSISTVGTWLTDWVNDSVFGEGFNLFGRESMFIPGIPVLVENALVSLGTSDWLSSLVLDGIVAGVGAVLGFLPQIAVLFFCLSLLEDCGYMSRIAFIMDRLFRRFGLSGKSFIPMLISTGCGVPGVMATRTIENESDRRMTIMTATFMPCGAKLPVIALISGALFNGAWWVAPISYFIGIAAVVLSGIILKKTRLFAGDTSPFLMELPAYHIPRLTNVVRRVGERSWDYAKRAASIIMISSILIWFFSNFALSSAGFHMVEETGDSILAVIGNSFAVLFVPLGFGHWEAAVAAITGLVAKENIIGTLGVLYGYAEVSETGVEMWGSMAASFGMLGGFSFLLFNLLCAPCFAAIAAIKKEMADTRWTVFAIAYQCGLAYLASLVYFQIASWVMGGLFTTWTIVAIAVIVVFFYFLFRPAASVRIHPLPLHEKKGVEL